MPNLKQTSSRVAKQAAETLRDPNASAVAKRLAGSVLSQASSTKETGKAMESEASRVLLSEKYSEATKVLAASVLSQSNKSR